MANKNLYFIISKTGVKPVECTPNEAYRLWTKANAEAEPGRNVAYYATVERFAYFANRLANETGCPVWQMPTSKTLVATASPSTTAKTNPEHNEHKPVTVDIYIDGGRNGNGPHCTVKWAIGDKSRLAILDTLPSELNGQQAMIEGLLEAFRAIKWPCQIKLHGNGTIDLLVACAKRGGNRKDGKAAQNSEKLAELGKLMAGMLSVEMIKE